MTPKLYLSQIRWLDSKINHRIEELKEYRDKISSLSAVSYDKDVVQTSSTGEAIPNAIAKLVDMERNIDKSIDIYFDFKKEIVKQIEGMDDIRYSTLLYERYVLYKPLDQIARGMNYEYDTIKHLHGRALESFGNIYNVSTKKHLEL